MFGKTRNRGTHSGPNLALNLYSDSIWNHRDRKIRIPRQARSTGPAPMRSPRSSAARNMAKFSEIRRTPSCGPSASKFRPRLNRRPAETLAAAVGYARNGGVVDAWIVEAALKNRTKQFIIDGEAVVLGVDGISDFDALQSRKHDEEVQLYAFDMLAGDGDDLRGLPLSMRKANLARLAADREASCAVGPRFQAALYVLANS